MERTLKRREIGRSIIDERPADGKPPHAIVPQQTQRVVVAQPSCANRRGGLLLLQSLQPRPVVVEHPRVMRDPIRERFHHV